MKLRTTSVVACLIALSIFACALPGRGDDDDGGIRYVLEASGHHAALGQSPGLRLSVTNNSGAPLSHVLEPSAYEVTIEGPGGHSVWFFLQHVMPTDLRIQSGQTAYLFGGAATYRYPDSAYFEHAGAYHLRYCDHWMIGGHEKKICSNNLEVNIGDGDADRDGQ